MDVDNSEAVAVAVAEPMETLVDGLFPRRRDAWGEANGALIGQCFFLRNSFSFCE